MDNSASYLSRDTLDALLAAIRRAGYVRTVGPTVDNGAIVYREIHSAADLPKGINDIQAPGSYRLSEVNSQRYFAWANGPQALKPLTFAPREPLWQCRRSAEGGLEFSDVTQEIPPTAVLGVRACDLAAMAIHSQHFLQEPYRDPHYQARRDSLFLIAVHCTHPADTCFCASTGDGPRAQTGFDLALAEISEGFLLTAGTPSGGRILAALNLPPASAEQQARADAEIAEAGQNQRRALPSGNLQERLYARLEHPHWDVVGRRCLSCGNCTAVCPTCFCHAELDDPVLDGSSSVHLRQWDSCFTAVHSYMGHFLVREETRLRYRQWLTHKLASWHEQYGRSGCVGCGRCVTWCPVGIDLTAEVQQLLETGDA